MTTYTSPNVLEVRIWGERVGAVALDPQTGFYVFEYAHSWQRKDIELAPTSMPISRSRHVFTSLPTQTYRRLPAMLADSLPDEFGSSLVTAYLGGQSVKPEMITSLDRLAFVASRAVGALEYRPTRGPRRRSSTALKVSELLTVSDLLIDVGSAGGSNTKALVSWNPANNKFRTGQAGLNAGFEHWLLKLAGPETNGEPDQAGRIEFAYYLMACAAGIEINESRLLHEDDRSHFITRRFDRSEDGSKLHIQTLCALGHLDFRLEAIHDYGQLFKMLDQLGLGPDERAEVYRRMVFNVAAANCDDHSKNFSFLLSEDGPWELAPAYDVTHGYDPASPSDSQHSMLVNGRSQDITADDLATMGDRFAVPSPSRLVSQVLDAVASWSEFAETAGVGEDSRKEIAADIRTMTSPLR